MLSSIPLNYKRIHSNYNYKPQCLTDINHVDNGLGQDTARLYAN